MNKLPDLSAVERQPWQLPGAAIRPSRPDAPPPAVRNALTRADLVAREKRFEGAKQ